MGLNQNTWKLNQWYDQDVAGNVSYTGALELFTWGSNAYGNLGQNTGANAHKSSPVQVPGNGWKYVKSQAYNQRLFALKTDGTFWACGNAPSGELAQNNRTSYSSPVQIPGTWDTSTKDTFGCGGQCNSAIKSDKTLWSWGYGISGTLGNGSNSKRSSPVQVPGSWESVCSFNYAALGIKTGGTLWCWGKNSNGVWGNNEAHNTTANSPKQVGSDATWYSVKGSPKNNVMAVKTDGTLWMWGTNSVGNLGQNQVSGAYSSPVQIPGTTWGLDTEKFHSCSDNTVAIKTDGTLWTWGRNDNGQLGQNIGGAPGNRSSPVQVPGTTWSSVRTGRNNTFASKTDGTLWSWGKNWFGMLGQNNETQYSSPVQVGSGTDWVRVGAGGRMSMGILLK